MFVKDTGFAVRLTYVSSLMLVLTLFHAFLVFSEALWYGAIPGDTHGRLATFGYWRIYSQPVSIFGILATLWLMRNNWAGWRYWVHIIVSVVLGAWNGVATGWGIYMYTQPCGSESLCAGEEPITADLPYNTRPDWAFLTLLLCFGLSGILHGVYILFNLWLRRSVELRLALQAASSRIALNPNAPVVYPGVWGSNTANGLVGTDMSALLDANGFHSATESQLYIHDAAYVYSELDNEYSPIDPEQAHEVAAYVRKQGVPFLHVVATPTINEVRAQKYSATIDAQVHDSYRPHFRQTFTAALGAASAAQQQQRSASQL